MWYLEPNPNRSTTMNFYTYKDNAQSNQTSRAIGKPYNHVRSIDNTDQRENDQTSSIRPNVSAGRPALRPVAATRTVNSNTVNPVSNGRPSIPPNRPNFRPAQFQNSTKDTTTTKSTNKQPNKLQSSITMMGMFTNPGGGPRGLLKFPPPPTEPPPMQDNTITSSQFKLIPLNRKEHNNNNNDQNFLNSRIKQMEGVAAKEKSVPRTLVNPNQTPPQKPPPPNLPKVKAIYDYSPQDLDELALKEGDIIEVLKEHEGGWWHGRLKGKTGLFPSNYVVKI